MTLNLLDGKTEGMNRRQLLGGGAAIVGGALVATALQSQQAHGQEAPAKAAAPSAAPNYAPPVVQVQGGKLSGFRDGKISFFLGIPYAEAERFELPKPVKPWEGVKCAQIWGPVSPIPQLSEDTIDETVNPHRFWVENEHCQVLNVWSPELSKTAKKPVMVWMHGGGFTNGSSMESFTYEGRNLSEFGDVVVVSMNHRLNIIGTLDLSAYGSQYAQSRYTGTADLVAALQWVHDNIENFGGDPGNVTIFGQSGGGSKVARMLHTPAAKGLFHKAVCQSGGGELYSEANPAKSIKTGQAIAAATLANLNLTGDQIDKLKAVPYPALLAAGEAALKTVAKDTGVRNLSWSVNPDDQYVTREFCDWASSIPLISGSVFSEHVGTLNKGTGKNEWTQKEIDEHLAAAFGDKKDALVAAFKEAYPHKKVQDVIFYALPNPRALAAKREAGKAPVYNFVFAYEYPVNHGITSFHTAEIPFVFHNLHDRQVRISTGDAPAGYALQDKVAGAWVNFAKTGNPSQPGLVWKQYTKADPQTMVFDIVSENRNLHYDKFAALMGDQGTFRG